MRQLLLICPITSSPTLLRCLLYSHLFSSSCRFDLKPPYSNQCMLKSALRFPLSTHTIVGTILLVVLQSFKSRLRDLLSLEGGRKVLMGSRKCGLKCGSAWLWAHPSSLTGLHPLRSSLPAVFTSWLGLSSSVETALGIQSRRGRTWREGGRQRGGGERAKGKCSIIVKSLLTFSCSFNYTKGAELWYSVFKYTCRLIRKNLLC